MAVSINVNHLGEHRSLIGPADGVDWIVLALVTAIRDNADWLVFQRESDRWRLSEWVGGQWHEMAPFPPDVPVAEAWGQFARSGFRRPRWRHWWRAAADRVRFLFRRHDPVLLWLGPKETWVSVPWRTVLWGVTCGNAVKVHIQAAPPARKVAAEIIERWRADRSAGTVLGIDRAAGLQGLDPHDEH